MYTKNEVLAIKNRCFQEGMSLDDTIAIFDKILADYDSAIANEKLESKIQELSQDRFVVFCTSMSLVSKKSPPKMETYTRRNQISFKV